MGKKTKILLTAIEFALASNIRIDQDAKLIFEYVEKLRITRTLSCQLV